MDAKQLEELERVRRALGIHALENELRRIRRLLERARHPSRTPEDEYEDLAVFGDDDEEEE